MIRNRILEIPVTTTMALFGVAIVLVLLTISIVGLFGGVLKELFYYLSTSHGTSVKTTLSDSNPVNVLITQE
jgi:hypothetical protein